MSIALCISPGLPSTMYAKIPRFAASLTQTGSVGLEQRDHGARGLAHDLGDQLQRVVAADAEADERQVRLLALRRRRHLADLELAGDHLVPEVR